MDATLQWLVVGAIVAVSAWRAARVLAPAGLRAAIARRLRDGGRANRTERVAPAGGSAAGESGCAGCSVASRAPSGTDAGGAGCGLPSTSRG